MKICNSPVYSMYLVDNSIHFGRYLINLFTIRNVTVVNEYGQDANEHSSTSLYSLQKPTLMLVRSTFSGFATTPCRW